MKNKKVAGRTAKNACSIFIGILVAVSFLAYFSAVWCHEKYGDVGFDAILFTLFSDIGGVATELVQNYLKGALAPALLFSVITLFILLFDLKGSALFITFRDKLKLRLYPFKKRVSVIVSVVLSAVLIAEAFACVGLWPWFKGLLSDCKFIETEYVKPSEVKLTFPEEKRNLIYIYLESMENTFLSKELGGALNYNVIPELYDLAKDNINFSDNTDVGGGMEIAGATWTIAAMTAQTAGIPLKLPVDGNSYGKYSQFLPGVTSITDILHNNGYYQALMVGSDASFGGRLNYFTQHGADKVYDYYTAVSDGIIPEDYRVWWGMEDKYLYEYAKQELTEISKSDNPFAFTMLTVDTHHVGGYRCELCGDEYGENYENVYSCASKQAAEFVKWLSEQDFFENTAIVITGDHCSMDAEYMSRNISEDYERHIYNCFINSAAEPVKEKGRVFSQFDMFPTTLAAMGVKIEGDRLGLGVNLFSRSKTLAEKYGFEVFNEYLQQKSNMYDSEFLYANNVKK